MIPLYIAYKNLLHIIRNLRAWWFLFVLPVVFISIFAFVFGEKDDEVQFNVVTNYSQSAHEKEYPQYLKGLEGLKNNSGENLFIFKFVLSQEEGYAILEDSKSDAFLEFNDSQITLRIDRYNTQGQAAAAIIGEYSDAYYGINRDQFEIVAITLGRGYASTFEYLVPGLIVYGILNLLPQVTYQLADEIRRNHVFRYFSAGVHGWEVILGHTLSFIITGGFQIVLMFAAIAVFGYTLHVQLLPLLAVISLTTLLVLGIGFCIGAITRSPDSASNISTLVSIILGFVSGAFVSFPKSVIFDGLSVVDFVPTYHAAEALRNVMQYNQGFDDMYLELSILIYTSLVLYISGSIMYSRNKLDTYLSPA